MDIFGKSGVEKMLELTINKLDCCLNLGSNMKKTERLLKECYILLSLLNDKNK